MKNKHWYILTVLAVVAHAGPGPLTTAIPAFLDTDRDGVISEAERQAFVQARKDARRGGLDWDLNGDGSVDDAERGAAVATLQNNINQKRADLFTQLAGDDSLMSLEEFASLPPFARTPETPVALLFGMLDANGDAAVTLDEFLEGTRGPMQASPPPRPSP